MTSITPYLLYEDCAAALDFLSRAFGFEERLRSIAPDGETVWHAETALGDAHVYMGDPGDEYRNPARLGEVTVSLYVYIDGDVDEHFERAKSAGAKILGEPENQEYGDRRYSAKDPEGHQWFFAQKIKEVAPEEWGAQVPAEAG
jgi:PhnB protein